MTKNRSTPTSPAVFDDRLAASAEGFAGMNAGRKPWLHGLEVTGG